MASCKPQPTQWEPKGDRPKDVLDQKSMTAVLLSMHLAEGDALERALPPEQTDSLLALHYGRLAREHETDLPTIQRSYAWYVARPLTLRAMYETVVEDLNRLQGEWQGEGTAKQAKEAGSEPAIGVGQPE